MAYSLSFFSGSLRVVLALLLTFVLAGCAAEAIDTPDGPDWPKAVTYEVFVHAFADGRGDGIGDFEGLTARLDYLQDLGVKALWLMPIHPAPSYHKYDVTDYRAIHPDYGTMDDFEHFLEEAHSRDIRVVIDLVLNHSSRDHPWFQAAIADTTSPYFDFYIWASGEQVDEMQFEETGPDTDNIDRWHPLDGYDDLYYYGFFWGGMPDLNYDNPATRDSVYAVGRYWLEKGVDGFRLDAARHIFWEGREADNYAFWEEFRAEMEAVNPEVLLVGEVWADAETVTPYLSGLTSVFNFDMAAAMVEAVETGRGTGLVEKHIRIREGYRDVAADFVDATFLTNHDQDRVMSVLDDEAKARVAASLLLTFPGAPYLYYGEEIGMRGMKPDPHIREPMLWDAEGEDTLRTRWIEPEYSTDETVTPVAQQLADDTSLLMHYRTLIHLRNSEPALTFGDIEPVAMENEALVAFLRNYDQESLLVVHNVGSEPAVELLPEAHQRFANLTYRSHDEAGVSEGTLSLPPYSTIVLHSSE